MCSLQSALHATGPCAYHQSSSFQIIKYLFLQGRLIAAAAICCAAIGLSMLFLPAGA